ncbi:fluoride efflux transporter family protein [Corynebacterium gerontici]|uniref:Fluoride-specific ion channel FluC n=1 Tax=Corynebacterium gerontici TaxID=2079234 RepID=A0A3G6IYM0_9CORY|nr:fluoride efflux transporter family protein [Corynebacterium gerontici]AZA10767.1 camphor resistance protein CrcB [Corynebacterium gerontici]
MRALNHPALPIALGAALGALTRYELSLLFEGAWMLLCINVIGSALMGVLSPPAWLGTGFLGGFTSFSTFTAVLLNASPWISLLYTAMTVFGCVGAWILGDTVRRRRL